MQWTVAVGVRPGGPSDRVSEDRGPSSHTRTLAFVVGARGAGGTWPDISAPFTHSPERWQSRCQWAPGWPASAAQNRVPLPRVPAPEEPGSLG